MMKRARSEPDLSTTASRESSHSCVSVGSMSGSCCLNWSKISCMPNHGTDDAGTMTEVDEGKTAGRAKPHRVLILGGGFAGVTTAQELEKRLGGRSDVEVWLASADNFLLFTPLLPEVCSGILELRHVVAPLRGMVRHASTWCITAEVEEIDLAHRRVSVMAGDGRSHRLAYDTLVLALGGITHTFGIPGLDEHAMGMKTLADAFSLRNRIIEMLERADLEEDAAARQRSEERRVGKEC